VQGVTTVIDWSGVDDNITPVYIADQAIAKTPCTGIMASFVTVDTNSQQTSILVPLSYANFETLQFFFYYAHDGVPTPVPVIAVDSPAASQYRLRDDLFCTLETKYTDVQTLCDCDSQVGHVDPWGVPLTAILVPIIQSQIVSDDTLPSQYTHILVAENGETIRADDHIFETQPQPATQAPFFVANVENDRMEAGGEFLHTTNTRFGELENIGVLYKDVSYADDPFLCAGVNAWETWHKLENEYVQHRGSAPFAHPADNRAQSVAGDRVADRKELFWSWWCWFRAASLAWRRLERRAGISTYLHRQTLENPAQENT